MMAGVAETSKVKERPNVSFRFPKDSSVQPEGFKKLTADAEVIVTVKGRLSSFSDKSSPWDQGKHFEIEMKSCEIEVRQKGVSLDEALEAAKKVE